MEALPEEAIGEELAAVTADIADVARLAVADQLDSEPVNLQSVSETFTDDSEAELAEISPKKTREREKKPATGTDYVPLEQGSLGKYLADIAKTPPLSRKTEIELATKMDAGKAAAAKLEEDSHKLSPNEIKALEDEIEYGQVARIHMILANLQLVAQISKRFMGQGLDRLDLIQEGSFGLFQAVDGFKWDKGNRFATYADWWIKEAMRRGISEQGKPFRFPPGVTVLVKEYKRRWYDMKEELGRKPTIEEVASEMKVNIDRLQAILASYDNSTLSLDSPRSDDGKAQLSNILADQYSHDVFETADNVLLRPLLVKILKETLNEREMQVMIWRLNLDGEGVRTLEEIGKHFNVTRKAINNIETKARKKLKTSFVQNQILDNEQ